jgi:hypothetical protein
MKIGLYWSCIRELGFGRKKIEKDLMAMNEEF